MKIIFLDIDGVLNRLPGGKKDWSVPEPLILFELVDRLNRIVRATAAKIVISSSWREIIFCGQMTVRGFQNLLHSHGCIAEVVDCTEREVKKGDDRVPRHIEVTNWLSVFSPEPIESYLVIDDWDKAGVGHPFIQTIGNVGLTEDHVMQAINILGMFNFGREGE